MSESHASSHKTKFSAKLFDVEEWIFRSKKGEKKAHHIVKRRPTVSVFPLSDSYEVYLVSQYRELYERVTLEAMAGYIDEGETSIQAAKRELKEETGIEALQWEEFGRIELAGSVIKATNHLFLAKDLIFGKAMPQDDEEISVVKLTLSEAASKVMSGDINHAASVAGILMLDKLKREKKL